MLHGNNFGVNGPGWARQAESKTGWRPFFMSLLDEFSCGHTVGWIPVGGLRLSGSFQAGTAKDESGDFGIRKNEAIRGCVRLVICGMSVPHGFGAGELSV